MIDKRVIADPHAHYGSGKAATRGFTWQRITGALNIAFLAFLIFLVVQAANATYAEFVSLLRNPFVGIGVALLIVNVCTHMRIGMREIIEDYLDEGRVNRLGLLLNDLFALLIGLVGVGSVIKIVFWG
jgi:succinate dehydrogenase / fumarate reductase, membrane anchor subunit